MTQNHQGVITITLNLKELIEKHNDLTQILGKYDLDAEKDNVELYLFIQKLVKLKIHCLAQINELNPNAFMNKTVLITGGSSGIGKSIVDLYLKAGANVIVFDIKDCIEHKGRVQYNNVDVRNKNMIQEAISNIESIDILITCAGVFDFDQNMNDEQRQKMVDINIHGVENMIESCMPLLKNNRGQICTITSGLSKTIDPTSLLYCITKQEIVKLTEKYAKEYETSGVRVNSVLPGPILTPLLVNVLPTVDDLVGYGNLNPQNMIGLPEWVALEVLRVTNNLKYNNYLSTEVDCGEVSMANIEDNKYWDPNYNGDYSFTINGNIYKWGNPYTKENHLS